MAESSHGFTIHLEQVEDFRFTVRFDGDGIADLLVDEPQPVGDGAGPNATRLLAAALGNCLSASLLFCMRKARIDARGLRTDVVTDVERDDRGRMRVGGARVTITLPEAVDVESGGIDRCLGLFEDYCVVTASVRNGIPVEVQVVTAAGEPVFSNDGA